MTARIAAVSASVSSTGTGRRLPLTRRRHYHAARRTRRRRRNGHRGQLDLAAVDGRGGGSVRVTPGAVLATISWQLSVDGTELTRVSCAPPSVGRMMAR